MSLPVGEVQMIDKRAAYTALKHEQEIHELSFSREAYGRSARIIDQMPIISDIDRTAILRLCNEIEELAIHIGQLTMHDTVYAEAQMIYDKVKEIGNELIRDSDCADC